MKKVTIQASSDVALIKYWGKKDEVLRLPENGSISLILSGLDTVTTVEFRDELIEDSVSIQGESDDEEVARVRAHLDRIRELAHSSTYAQVMSHNTFPRGTGLSSSGSGFAALTLAATQALELSLDERSLSILARQGSGTACRCVCGGIVEWIDGATSEASYSHTLYPPDYWDIRDVVAVVDSGKKRVSSTEGHASAHASPFFQKRQELLGQKIEQLKSTILARDFAAFGSLVESEALEFHSILLTSQPPLIAWYPGTIEVMVAVQAMRREGIPAYFTINTGFNVHVLTLPQFVAQVQSNLQSLSSVKKTILASIGSKPQTLDTHLF